MKNTSTEDIGNLKEQIKENLRMDKQESTTGKQQSNVNQDRNKNIQDFSKEKTLGSKSSLISS